MQDFYDDKLFSEKRNVNSESTIIIFRDLLSYKEWGMEQIKDRQEKLAKLALQVWSIK